MMMARLFVCLQFLVPKRALSELVGWLAQRRGGALSQFAMRVFIRVFRVDMSEAAEPEIHAYPTFNAFFTRALRADARPLPDQPPDVACPADGIVSEFGQLTADRLLQAKGVSYSVLDLLDGDRSLAARFSDGAYFTVYLAPGNYHRVHMPLAGRSSYLRYIPGALFSVNAATTRVLTDLFCRNERVATVFETERGAFALVMVGAMNVGSIELCLPPTPLPFRNRPRSTWASGMTHALDGVEFQRGDEFGRFNMGSTVVLLATPGLLVFDPTLAVGSSVRMGQTIARQP